MLTVGGHLEELISIYHLKQVVALAIKLEVLEEGFSLDDAQDPRLDGAEFRLGVVLDRVLQLGELFNYFVKAQPKRFDELSQDLVGFTQLVKGWPKRCQSIHKDVAPWLLLLRQLRRSLALVLGTTTHLRAHSPFD